MSSSYKKPEITEWLVLAMDVVHRAARQLGGAVELESSVNKLRETNMCLTDQKMVIDLQFRMIEKKNRSSNQFKKLCKRR